MPGKLNWDWIDMRLLELTLTDFGVFQGKNKIDLKPRSGQIVIFGGKNGSGKTTLLEAIRICLYGMLYLGQRANRKDYDEYIENKFHRRRDSLVPINQTSLSLKFEYSQGGEHHEYDVTRSWKKKGTGITEQLFVKQDGTYLTDMAEDRWQDFIDDLIPSGVASLFFFDGEKIQSLASDNQGEQILGEEIKRLLGLTIIERLQLDLDLYLYRQRKESSITGLVVRVDEAKKARDIAEDEYKALRQDRSHTEALVVHVKGKITDLEQRISRESSGFGIARDSLRSELARVEAEIGQTERSINDLITGLLPFALVPELSQQLRTQLVAEAEYQQWDASQKMIAPRILKIREYLAGYEKSGNNQHPTANDITSQFNEMLDQLELPPKHIAEMQALHQVSDSERMQLLGWINLSIEDIPRQSRELAKKLDLLEQERIRLEEKLHKVPDDIVLRPIMDELNQNHQKLGELQSVADQQDKKLSTLHNRVQETQRSLQKAYEDLRSGEDLDQRLELVTKVQNVLQVFLTHLTSEKLKKLESLVAERFNEIIQKTDLIQTVSIDPDQFRISLFNTEGKEIPKEGLSAGEKQMFAIATLWALRQLSGRPFPVVIDTPLGRLDREHRDSLIENYFPFISHQVILFSTDTEVDQTYFEALQPHISHAYHLTYNSNRGATDFQEGYFWGEHQHAA